MLCGVSHVMVDEIHERGMNEDFLDIILRDLLVVGHFPLVISVTAFAFLPAIFVCFYLSGARPHAPRCVPCYG